MAVQVSNLECVGNGPRRSEENFWRQDGYTQPYPSQSLRCHERAMRGGAATRLFRRSCGSQYAATVSQAVLGSRALCTTNGGLALK